MITPGIGYTFRNSPDGFSLEIEQQSQTTEHPFKVYEDSTAEGTAVLRISAGTINNSLPTVGGAVIGTANAYLAKPGGSGFVYLMIPASNTDGASFPASTPQVLFASTVPTYGLTTAYVGLAKVDANTVDGVQVITIQQLVTGSLWGERFKCGSTLDYWFSQI